MLKNYFLVMIRNLRKRKGYALINLLGLATGMAVCLLLLLYIQNEFGYDRWHEKGDRLYRLALERKYPGRSAFFGEIPQSIGQAMKKEFPEVLQSCRVASYNRNGSAVKAGDKQFEEKGLFVVDSNFFQLFTASFLFGDMRTALQKPGTVVLNESTARRIFGSAEKAMGQVLAIDNSVYYTVAGVCADWPEKSHLQFNLLLSMTGFQGLNQPDYYDLYCYDYLLLDKQARPEALEAKFPIIIDKYVAGTIQKGFGESFRQFTTEGNGYRYFLQPIQDIHLHSDLIDELSPNGSIRAVTLFAVIAVFILFLACINFINLSTALSVERAKEVGIRKTFGSARKALIWQFLAESVFFSIASMLIAFLLAWLLLPLMNNIAGVSMSFVWLLNPVRLLLLLIFAISVGVSAGLYPALALSSFQPIAVLKGRFKAGRQGRLLRNGLVIFQFAVSVILIICTLIVNNQMHFVLGDKLGFKRDHIIAINQLYRLQQNKIAFVEGLSAVPGVELVSRCSDLPGGDLASCAMQIVGSHVSRTQLTQYTDENYFKLLGLQLKEGRLFDKSFTTDSLGVILNEQAVEDFGLKDPIGARITSTETFLNPADGKSQNIFTVIGVVRDYHFQSLHKKIAPLVFLNSNKFGWATAAIRISGDHFSAALKEIGDTWARLNPKHSMQFAFFDQSLAAQYKSEETAQRIFTIFSLLAIFIACIGLFGLATYSTLQRIREIGIRKVLGATPGGIIFILSKDFLGLVLVSLLIAFPIAWWAMHRWLQDFAYRVDIAWWVFLLAGATALLIALATISFQAIRAALANPIKSLRTE